jgi:hypothetical protein
MKTITLIPLFLAIALACASCNETTNEYEFWDAIPSENGNYKIKLYSLTTKSNGNKELIDLQAEGTCKIVKGQANLGVYFRETGYCKIRLNDWCSQSIKLEWLTETGRNQFTLIPRGNIVWSDMIKGDFFSSHLPQGDARLVILHKTNTTEHRFLIVIATKK